MNAPEFSDDLQSDSQDSPEIRSIPHNIEAEQSLIGAVMLDNEYYHRVSAFLTAEHFYEPVHQRIYEAIMRLIERSELADPVTLKRLFEDEPALQHVGGADYLFQLTGLAETLYNIEDYGRLILDLSIRRSLIRVGKDVSGRASDPQDTDSAVSQIELAEQELFNLAQHGDVGGEALPLSRFVSQAVDQAELALRNPDSITGVPTGLRDLDDKLGGLQPSDLLILAGRPSMGKTALAVTIGVNASRHMASGPAGTGREGRKFGVAIFSLEMSGRQLAMRLLAGVSRISQDKLMRGDFSREDLPLVTRAAQDLAALDVYVDDTPALSINALRTRARRLVRTQQVSLIVVDYLQLLRGVSKQGQSNKVHEVSEITQGLKAIAKELNIPVIALSQLSRKVEERDDKRPQLSDLRDSGSIEQDADVVMFVFREDYYLERAEPKHPRADEKPDKHLERYQQWQKRFEEARGMADVIIAKQRNGPIGTVRTTFDGGRGTFENAEFRDYDVH